MDLFVGFDSAWADNPKAPGAICAAVLDGPVLTDFHEPQLVSFDQALQVTASLASTAQFTLIAIDQPTIVPNMTGMRPVERVVASLISWLGGGVQPANRGKVGLFCDTAPIWPFLEALAGTEDPEAARIAETGRYVMEVFPALALPSLDSRFHGRLAGPRYNPGRRKTFRLQDWNAVATTAAAEFQRLGFEAPAEWCAQAAHIPAPKKHNQDRLDSLLCLLTALRWRLRPRSESVLLGDLSSGYMVAPVSLSVRTRLSVIAKAAAVPIDGAL
jgi:predicted RNase H-like nuclease